MGLLDDYITNGPMQEIKDIGQAKALALVSEFKKAYPTWMLWADTIKTYFAINWKPFTRAQVNDVIEETIKQVNYLRETKGGEYAGDTDALGNFRRNAASLGVNPETIWAVYAGKHWDAIQQWVKDLEAGTDRPRSEPITGRLDDLIVYCILAKCLYLARQEQKDG